MLKIVLLVLAKNKVLLYYTCSERLGAPLTQAFAALIDKFILVHLFSRKVDILI